MYNRRSALGLAAAGLAAILALSACAGAAERTPVTADDVTMGDPEAQVTLVEYHSVACPFCAQFNIEVFPHLKEAYIDTGQVHYVSREMLAHNPSMAAAGFLMARCAGAEQYFDVVDAIYANQQDMERTGRYREGLLRIARAHGLSEEEFEACISDTAAIEALNARVEQYVRGDGIVSTPTFVINGRQIEGALSAERLDELIADAKSASSGG
jgi:protein-disulfide isomerase